MSDTKAILAERLAISRANCQMTQEEASDATGIAPSAISHYERGRRAPEAENLVSLADAYGVSVDYLLGRKNTP